MKVEDKKQKVELKNPEQANDHIVKYLDWYKRADNVDTAVMISGPWGCGKSFFIDAWLAGSCVDMRTDKPEYLKISLNGVSSVADIDALLFRAAHPKLGGKSARLAGTILKGLCSALRFTHTVSDGNKGKSKEVGFDVEKLVDMLPDSLTGDADVLVFDDLERCLLDIESLMGYFADLLDGRHRIILVCAEEELKKAWKKGPRTSSGRQGPDYATIKEKVVGRTFVLENEISDLYSVLVDKAACDTAGDVLHRNRDAIVKNFKAVDGACNYRALMQAFRDVDYWIGMMPKKERENNEFADDFVRAFVAIDYEIKIGELPIKEFGRVSGYSGKATMFEQHCQRYGISPRQWSMDGYEPLAVLPVGIMGRMLRSQKVSEKELANAVGSLAYFMDASKQSDWQRLYHWHMTEDADLQKLIEKVNQDLSSRTYTKPEEIMHVFSVLADLAKYGVLGKKSSTVCKECRQYVQAALKAGTLESPMEVDNFGDWRIDDGAYGYQYIGAFDSTSEYKSMRGAINDALDRLQEQKSRVEIKALEKTLADFRGTFYLQLRDQESFWYRHAVFHLLAPKKFVDGFQRMPNVDKHKVGELLLGRWRRSIAKQETEAPFWTSVARVLQKEFAKHKKTTPSLLQEKIFYNALVEKWGCGEKIKIRA